MAAKELTLDDLGRECPEALAFLRDRAHDRVEAGAWERDHAVHAQTWHVGSWGSRGWQVARLADGSPTCHTSPFAVLEHEARAAQPPAPAPAAPPPTPAAEAPRPAWTLRDVPDGILRVALARVERPGREHAAAHAEAYCALPEDVRAAWPIACASEVVAGVAEIGRGAHRCATDVGSFPAAVIRAELARRQPAAALTLDALTLDALPPHVAAMVVWCARWGDAATRPAVDRAAWAGWSVAATRGGPDDGTVEVTHHGPPARTLRVEHAEVLRWHDARTPAHAAHAGPRVVAADALAAAEARVVDSNASHLAADNARLVLAGHETALTASAATLWFDGVPVHEIAGPLSFTVTGDGGIWGAESTQRVVIDALDEAARSGARRETTAPSAEKATETMTKASEQVAPDTGVVATLKADGAEALWRAGGSQFSRLSADSAAALLARHLGDESEAFRARCARFLATDVGRAMLDGLLALALTTVPGEVPARLAREMRVRSLAGGADLVAELVAAPLRELLATTLRDVAPTIAAVPAALTDGTGGVATLADARARQTAGGGQ